MNRFLVMLQIACVMLFFETSCTKSEFSTTVSQKKNGKTTFKNIYQRDKIKLLSKKSPGTLQENKTVKKQRPADITRIDPIQTDNEILIASNSKEPVILANSEFKFVKAPMPSSHPHEQSIQTVKADTIRAVRLDSGNRHAYGDARVTEKLGLSGFILTLVGWVFVFGIPLSVLGIVFGAISLGKIKRNPAHFKGKGFAIASLVLGIIGVVVGIVFLAGS